MAVLLASDQSMYPRILEGAPPVPAAQIKPDPQISPEQRFKDQSLRNDTAVTLLDGDFASRNRPKHPHLRIVDLDAPLGEPIDRPRIGWASVCQIPLGIAGVHQSCPCPGCCIGSGFFCECVSDWFEIVDVHIRALPASLKSFLDGSQRSYIAPHLYKSARHSVCSQRRHEWFRSQYSLRPDRSFASFPVIGHKSSISSSSCGVMRGDLELGGPVDLGGTGLENTSRDAACPSRLPTSQGPVYAREQPTTPMLLCLG